MGPQWGPGTAVAEPAGPPDPAERPPRSRLGERRQTDAAVRLTFARGRAEYQQICLRTAVGLMVMGFVGFFVKLVFIPIKSIILGA